MQQRRKWWDGEKEEKEEKEKRVGQYRVGKMIEEDFVVVMVDSTRQETLEYADRVIEEMLDRTQNSCGTVFDGDKHTSAGGAGTNPVDGGEDKKGNRCHLSGTISKTVDNIPKLSVCVLLNFCNIREGVAG